MTAHERPGILVVALAFVRKGDAILMVRQGYGDRYWSLPGGTMEAGESVQEAVIREVREETGLEVDVTRLVGVYSKPAESALALTFACQVIGGTMQADNEIVECGFYPLDRLPQPARAHLAQRVADYRADLDAAVIRTQ